MKKIVPFFIFLFFALSCTHTPNWTQQQKIQRQKERITVIGYEARASGIEEGQKKALASAGRILLAQYYKVDIKYSYIEENIVKNWKTDREIISSLSLDIQGLPLPLDIEEWHWRERENGKYEVWVKVSAPENFLDKFMRMTEQRIRSRLREIEHNLKLVKSNFDILSFKRIYKKLKWSQYQLKKIKDNIKKEPIASLKQFSSEEILAKTENLERKIDEQFMDLRRNTSVLILIGNDLNTDSKVMNSVVSLIKEELLSWDFSLAAPLDQSSKKILRLIIEFGPVGDVMVREQYILTVATVNITMEDRKGKVLFISSFKIKGAGLNFQKAKEDAALRAARKTNKKLRLFFK